LAILARDSIVHQTVADRQAKRGEEEEGEG